MKRVNKETNQQPVYVNIRENREVRKSLLESVKDTLILLQKRELIKKVREDKLHTIDQLSNTIKEIKEMTSRLKIALPKVDRNILKSKEEKSHRVLKKKEEKKEDEAQAEEKEAVKRELSEIEKLEAEIKSIEDKLSSLS